MLCMGRESDERVKAVSASRDAKLTISVARSLVCHLLGYVIDRSSGAELVMHEFAA